MENENLLALPVEQELRLLPSALRGLHRISVYTLGDLISCSERDIRRAPSIGDKTLRSIEHQLQQLGLMLAEPNEPDEPSEPRQLYGVADVARSLGVDSGTVYYMLNNNPDAPKPVHRKWGKGGNRGRFWDQNGFDAVQAWYKSEYLTSRWGELKPARKCSVESCRERAIFNGMCEPHDYRWRLYGDAQATPIRGLTMGQAIDIACRHDDLGESLASLARAQGVHWNVAKTALKRGRRYREVYAHFQQSGSMNATAKALGIKGEKVGAIAYAMNTRADATGAIKRGSTSR